MKVIPINIILVVIFTISIPGAATAQSFCEGLTTMLTADRHELELYLPPGATMCTTATRSGQFHTGIACIWPKPPKPDHLNGNKQGSLQWYNTTYMPDVKKLANAVRQCIEQNKIPGNWGRLKTYGINGLTLSYYFQKSRNQTEKMSQRRKELNDREPLTIAVCFEKDDDNDAGTAGIVLEVDEDPRGESNCILAF